jgi:hypothetical protein
MTKDPHKLAFLSQCRVREAAVGHQWTSTDDDGMNGAFMIPCYNDKLDRYDRLGCIASDQGGWEHVSVTVQTGPKSHKRAPNWEQMARAKRAFWDDDECVVEYHVPMAEWFNEHQGCLHLWKKTGYEFPRPPALYVGVPEQL